jgi:hypothetical protein
MIIQIKINVDKTKLSDPEHFRDARNRLRKAFKLDDSDEAIWNAPEPLRLVKRIETDDYLEDDDDAVIVAGRPFSWSYVEKAEHMPPMPEDDAVTFLSAIFKCSRPQAKLILKEQCYPDNVDLCRSHGIEEWFSKEWFGDILLYRGNSYRTPEEKAEERRRSEEREKKKEEERKAAEKAREERWAQERIEKEKVKAIEKERLAAEIEAKRQQAEIAAEEHRQEAERLAEKQKRRIAEAKAEDERVRPIIEAERSRLKAIRAEVIKSMRLLPRFTGLHHKSKAADWLAERWEVHPDVKKPVGAMILEVGEAEGAIKTVYETILDYDDPHRQHTIPSGIIGVDVEGSLERSS